MIGVSEGTRTPDTRDHNPVLYLLSYTHHDSATNDSGITGRSAQRPAAIAFAASTSGPGSGTNTVRR
jgi:hypothetical protein